MGLSNQYVSEKQKYWEQQRVRNASEKNDIKIQLAKIQEEKARLQKSQADSMAKLQSSLS